MRSSYIYGFAYSNFISKVKFYRMCPNIYDYICRMTTLYFSKRGAIDDNVCFQKSVSFHICPIEMDKPFLNLFIYRETATGTELSFIRYFLTAFLAFNQSHIALPLKI
nr:MAG TPA: hypothetical protein [Caudoviricetes sp.]